MLSTANPAPVVKALHNVADLMDRDRAANPAREDVTDFMILMRACYGPLMRWDRMAGEYGFAPCPVCGTTLADLRHRRAEVEAARTLLALVTEALGAEHGTSMAEVRAVADRLADLAPATHAA